MIPALLRRPGARTALAFSSGLLCVIGFAPVAWFLLPPLFLAVLFALWRTAGSSRESAQLGLAFGLGLFLAGVSWVYVSLSEFGGMAMPLAAGATLLFCFYLALYPALAGWLFGRWRGNAERPTAMALLFAGLWTLTEWLRGTLFTGFPWLAVGYSQSPPSPLAGWASALGVYGVSFMVALVAGLLGTMLVTGWQRPGRWFALFLLLGLGQLLLAMPWTQPVGKPLSVSLLQGNVPQSLKWDPQHLPLSVETYLKMANDTKAPLTQLNILPETALPLFLHQVPLEILHDLTRQGDALLGIAVTTRDGGYTNSAVGLTREMKASAYAKRHLVPFGEYAPPGFAWFFRFANIPMSSFSAGTAQQPLLELAGQKILPTICYEDVFGEELIAALPTATLLVNLSNTAWFGNSWAQPQHLQIAQMRALESGRSILRATNTGMTALITPDGRVAATLPAFTRGVLRVEAQGYSGLTPYAKWGNVLILILAVLSCLPAWRGRNDT